MTKQILLLRISYWTAAIADFSIAILAWLPERMGLTETAYPMGLTSAIAFSWGVMLLMADRKPLERKWVLIPTVLVITLITLVRTGYSLDGAIKFDLALLLFAVTLIIVMTYSYYFPGKEK
jgi:hypothetical protein